MLPFGVGSKRTKSMYLPLFAGSVPQPCQYGMMWNDPPRKNPQGAKTAVIRRRNTQPSAKKSSSRGKQPKQPARGLRGTIGLGENGRANRAIVRKALQLTPPRISKSVVHRAIGRSPKRPIRARSAVRAGNLSRTMRRDLRRREGSRPCPQ